MVLPFRLRHLTINPQQTRRRPRPNPINLNPSPHTTSSHLKTASPNLPPNHTNSILNPSSRPPRPHMNRRPASRTPIHYYRTNRLHRLLRHHRNPNANRRNDRKQHPRTRLKALIV